jgi:hypothetical protein
MMNSNLQSAFSRVDVKMSGYVNHPSVPSIIKSIYTKVKGFMASMGSVEQQQAAQNGGGGMAGMMRSCSIF